jgi:hypothetical protein
MSGEVDPGDDGSLDEVPLNERPTLPVPAPRGSEVRVRLTRIPWSVATADIVACDRSRDPRSEDYAARMLSGIAPAVPCLELVLEEDDVAPLSA